MAEETIKSKETEKEYSLFNRFRSNILKEKTSEVELPREYLCNQDLVVLRFGALIVIIVNIFWLVMDAVKGGTMNLLHGAVPIVLAIQFSLSIATIIASFKKEKMSLKSKEILIFLFHLSVFLLVTILRVTKNITIVENGAVNPYNGISISSYMLIAVALAPLPSRWESVALFLSSLFILGLPSFLPGAEAYSLLGNSILQGTLLLIYFIFRKLYLRLGEAFCSMAKTGNKLTYTSYVDPLTGLLNRRALDKYLENLKSGSVKEVGIFFFDVDDFKKYNDAYTHIKGDQVLQSVGNAVVEAFKNEPAYVFRYGGEEFVLIFENADEESMVIIGERIRQVVHDVAIPRNDIEGTSIVTVTVGCALENTDSADKDLISAADNALYEGKTGTKDCVFFAKQMRLI